MKSSAFDILFFYAQATRRPPPGQFRDILRVVGHRYQDIELPGIGCPLGYVLPHLDNMMVAFWLCYFVTLMLPFCDFLNVKIVDVLLIC